MEPNAASNVPQWHLVGDWFDVCRCDIPCPCKFAQAPTDRETVQRRDRADALAQKHGASIEEVYWTVGPCDLVTVVEAPDDESATTMLLELGTAGNLRTTTLRAYDREEMSGIIQRLG